MAKFSLVPFTIANAPKIIITAEFNQNSDSFFISFSIKNDLQSIDLGDSTPCKERIIKLWEKTCFELFIKNQNGAYLEFNFSPNFGWNCFFFNQKGEELKEWETMQMPSTDVLLSIDHFLLVAEIKKIYFPKTFFDRSNNVANNLEAGITCVIKDKLGTLSYWALAHCDTRPNFHHFDSFKYKFLSQ